MGAPILRALRSLWPAWAVIMFLLRSPVMDQIMPPPPKAHVEFLTPKMTVFGDGSLKEIIKVKRGHVGRALIPQD